MFERFLKLSHTDASRVYFTSDLHIGHNKPFIYESRGFVNIREYNEAVIKSINDNVREQDILLFLGDWCLNSTYEQFNTSIDSLKCQTIYSLFGNHNSGMRRAYEDSVKEQYGFDDVEVYPVRYKNIVFLGYYKEITVNGICMVLSHYPLYSWNAMKKNTIMLHGHEHCAIKNHTPEGTDGKILDVGFDYFKRPISFDEVIKIMEKKITKSIGHH